MGYIREGYLLGSFSCHFLSFSLVKRRVENENFECIMAPQ